jgi:hypothetical protein
MNQHTVLATVTNYGYLLYTRNMLKSLEPFGLDKSVMILCLDQKSAQILLPLGYSVTYTEEDVSQFCSWNTEGYDKICYLKLKWIHSLLLTKNVVMIDGDIVFRKNPWDDILQWQNNSATDVWIQNDGMVDSERENLCTGYQMIRSNQRMRSLYDCMSERSQYQYTRCALQNNDQTYFNLYVKPHCTVRALPLRDYPNGGVFYRDAASLSPTMVHFNWIVGHEKKEKMKEYNMWLLTEDA